MNKLTAAYLAGFIDGEGYIGIMKMRNQAVAKGYVYLRVLKIASTDKRIIDWLCKSFGGSTEVRIWDESSNNKDAYCWQLRGKKLEPFLRKTYPYLKMKKRQAEIILKSFKIKAGDESVKHIIHSGWNWKYTKQALEEFERFRQQIRQLNHRGKKELVQPERLSETTLRGSDSPPL